MKRLKSTKKNTDKIIFDKDKRLEIRRVRTIACAIMQVPVLDLEKETDKASVARMLIVSYLLSKGYSREEVSFVARTNINNINDDLGRYQRLKNRNVDFANIEISFKRKVELCCAKA